MSNRKKENSGSKYSSLKQIFRIKPHFGKKGQVDYYLIQIDLHLLQNSVKCVSVIR